MTSLVSSEHKPYEMGQIEKAVTEMTEKKKSIKDLLTEKKAGLDKNVDINPALKKGILSLDDEFMDLVNLVSFQLQGHSFGVEIGMVQEVVRFHEITRVPHLVNYIMGVMNLRGSITPIINLRVRLGLDDAEITEDARIIIIKLHNNSIGFAVDSVSQILHIPKDKIEPPPEVVNGVDTKFIQGVAKIDETHVDNSGMIVILNLEEIYDKNKIQEFKFAG